MTPHIPPATQVTAVIDLDLMVATTAVDMTATDPDTVVTGLAIVAIDRAMEVMEVATEADTEVDIIDQVTGATDQVMEGMTTLTMDMAQASKGEITDHIVEETTELTNKAIV